MKNESENIDGFVFVSSGSKLGNRVSLGKTKSLYFTPDNAKSSGIVKIKQVLVGYNPATGEIVLKPCEPDEYGSSMVKDSAEGKSINVAHIVKRINTADYYEYRLHGKLVILKPIEKEKE